MALYEPELARAVAGRDRIAANLERSVAKGRLSPEDRDATLARLVPTDDTGAASDADLVVEAVFEDVDVKSRLWADLDGIAPTAAVFASNTSRSRSIASRRPSTRRAGPGSSACTSSARCPVMPLIELIRGSATDDATEAAVREVAGELGKQVIVSADRPGFIVNRILMPFLAEAMRAYEEGLGTADDIDTGAKVGLNHPMGPLELADFIGLDVCLGILRVLARGARSAAVRAAARARGPRRGRAPRPEDRAGVPHLPPLAVTPPPRPRHPGVKGLR